MLEVMSTLQEECNAERYGAISTPQEGSRFKAVLEEAFKLRVKFFKI
jgi:hypothetical protein